MLMPGAEIEPTKWDLNATELVQHYLVMVTVMIQMIELSGIQQGEQQVAGGKYPTPKEFFKCYLAESKNCFRRNLNQIYIMFFCS